jgi:hypothetical protein
MDPKQFELLIATIDHAKWTEIVSVLVLVLGFVIAIGSLIYARKQIKADHERSRRLLAMEMCSRWSSSSSPETSSVIRMIERLTEAQCAAIANQSSVLIEEEHKHFLLNIFLLRFPEFGENIETLKEGNAYRIEGQHVLYLRHIAVRYLNMLESVLMTWTGGIADQRMIESEFSFLLDEKQGRTAVEKLRMKIGNETFPAINKFMEALRQKASQRSEDIVRPPTA